MELTLCFNHYRRVGNQDPTYLNTKNSVSTYKLLRLGARYRLEAPNGRDTKVRSQVLGRSVGESVHPIFIRVGRKIVPIYLPQLAIICLLKIKKEIIKFNSRK
jgi:hypothetical protein